VVEPAEHVARTDGADCGRFDGAPLGRILDQGQMRSVSQVIRDVLSKKLPGMGLAEDDDLVEQLSSKCSDDAFAIRVLPRRARRRRHVLDAHRLDGSGDALAVDAVSVSMEEARCSIEGEGIAELLRCPRRRRVGGDRDVPDATAAVLEDDEAVQEFERRRGNDEEVHGRSLEQVVLQKRALRLRRWLPGAGLEVRGDGRLRDTEAQLEQLAVDSRRAPGRVVGGEAANQSQRLSRLPVRLAPGHDRGTDFCHTIIAMSIERILFRESASGRRPVLAQKTPLGALDLGGRRLEEMTEELKS